jgi:hypothetical protein
MACFPSNQANVIMVAYGDCNCGVSPFTGEVGLFACECECQ